MWTLFVIAAEELQQKVEVVVLQPLDFSWGRSPPQAQSATVVPEQLQLVQQGV
jgi:hypothetical protein